MLYTVRISAQSGPTVYVNEVVVRAPGPVTARQKAINVAKAHWPGKRNYTARIEEVEDDD